MSIGIGIQISGRRVLSGCGDQDGAWPVVKVRGLVGLSPLFQFEPPAIV